MARQIGTRKIGNYIHFYHANYLKYGIGNREQGRAQESISNILAEQKQLIFAQSKFSLGMNNKINIKQEIEQKLNYFRPQGKFDGEIKIKSTEIENKIRNLVLKRLKLKNATINWETLTVLNSGQFDVERAKMGGKNRARSRLNETTETNEIQSIKNRLETLKRTWEDLVMKRSNQADDLKERLKKINQDWEEISKKLSITTRFGRQYIIGANNFIKDLNDLWNSFSKEVNSYLTGELGEQYAAISAVAYEYFVKKEGNGLVTDFEKWVESLSDSQLGLRGKQRSASILSSRFFATFGKTQDMSSSHFINGNQFTNFLGGKSRIYYTQDKVDLEVSLERLGPISASIKNYNLSSGYNLSVHTGISILALSQEYTNFINHYLNITVEHYDASNVYISQMNNMLKLTLGLKAIAGGIYKFSKNGNFGKNQTAEVLILNDSSGNYKVYFIQELIDKIANDIDLLEIKGLDAHKTWKQYWVNSTSNSTGIFSNPNYKDAYSRINGILSQLHAFKLDISLKPRIFI